MPFSQSLLADVFLGPPTFSEAEAIDYLATRWTAFFAGSTVAGTPATLSALAAPETAFRGAAVGISQANQGLVKLSDAIVAFWTAAVAVAPAVWIPPGNPIVPGTALPPPGITSIIPTLTPVFAANLAAKLEQGPAADAVATALLPLNIGGTVTLTLPPPSGTPGVPIL